MISFDEATAIVTAAARPLGRESVALAAAAGRVLAAPVIARVNAPPTDVSMMDGYAVREADLGTTTRFRVIGAAYPGAPSDAALTAGACIRVFTGAPLPAGADRVIVQENVRQEGEVAIVETMPSANRFVRPRGADFAEGEVVLDAGRLLDPRALIAAAGGDVGAVTVWRRPRVSMISTGDELAEPGEARDLPHRIPESLSFGILALAEGWGAQVVTRCRVRDEPEAIQARAAAALAEADLVIIAGGASVGEKDFARRAFLALGAEILFPRVAIMPGKPVWFARVGDRLVLGLPGNPSSAMVTARLFLAPLLAGLGGRDPAVAMRWRRLPLAAALPPSGDRESFVRATHDTQGVRAVSSQDSGMQRALAQADLLVRRLPNAAGLAAGSLVDALFF